ncbi:hypothetical protein GWI33_014709 [Rhynchophorus ferrugineus]|uniref:Uncharacterized protein n=1 Tax=Rhynchophorus ferrugineus TaxID=354439 RepID=A0A834I3Y5_RHYFE|nr:hypothetical protein GWI33_014709 [Rhynchophorus ferrugineus]
MSRLKNKLKAKVATVILKERRLPSLLGKNPPCQLETWERGRGTRGHPSNASFVNYIPERVLGDLEHGARAAGGGRRHLPFSTTRRQVVDLEPNKGALEINRRYSSLPAEWEVFFTGF